jgi:hypothetical protein
MHRVLFLLAAVGGITGGATADATYTIAAATAEDANARAARYCSCATLPHGSKASSNAVARRSTCIVACRAKRRHASWNRRCD